MNKAIRNVCTVKPGTPHKTSAIILAAGEANRMRSYGPRSLLRISEYNTLFSHQLSILEKYIPGIETILVCGHDADRVMNQTPTHIIKVENEQYSTTNVVKSIGMGLRAATGDRVVLIYGDLAFNAETIKYMNLEQSSIVIDSGGLFSDEEVGCTINSSMLAEHLFYDLPNKWAQICILTGKELSIMQKISWDKTHSNWFGFEAINEVIRNGGQFTCQSPKKMKIFDIDSTKNLQDIKYIL